MTSAHRQICLALLLLVLSLPFAPASRSDVDGAAAVARPTSASIRSARQRPAPPTCFGQAATIKDHKGKIRGTNGDDIIIGNGKANDINPGGGHDLVCGLGGNDTILAPSGQRLVADGGPGNDELLGTSGNDILFGAEGNDTLGGNSGDDNLSGGPGEDDIFGTTGNDTLHGDEGNDQLQGNDGVDTLDGGPGNDICDQDFVDFGEPPFSC